MQRTVYSFIELDKQIYSRPTLFFRCAISIGKGDRTVILWRLRDEVVAPIEVL